MLLEKFHAFFLLLNQRLIFSILTINQLLVDIFVGTNGFAVQNSRYLHVGYFRAKKMLSSNGY